MTNEDKLNNLLASLEEITGTNNEESKGACFEDAVCEDTEETEGAVKDAVDGEGQDSTIDTLFQKEVNDEDVDELEEAITVEGLRASLDRIMSNTKKLASKYGTSVFLKSDREFLRESLREHIKDIEEIFNILNKQEKGNTVVRYAKSLIGKA